jgi:hypothetical protein
MDTKFKMGDKVRMQYYGRWAYGEVTIPLDDTSKVLFDGDYNLDYWYYPNNELELIESERKSS